MAHAKTYTKVVYIGVEPVKEKFNIGEHVYLYFMRNNDEPYRSNWIRGTVITFYRGGASGTWVKLKIDTDFEHPHREVTMRAESLHHFPHELSEKERKKFGYYEI